MPNRIPPSSTGRTSSLRSNVPPMASPVAAPAPRTASGTSRDFTVLDALATTALKTLGTAFDDAGFRALLGSPAALTAADLAALSKGKLANGKAVPPALAKDLGAAAAYLSDAKNQPYLNQILGAKGCGQTEVKAALAAGFHDPHAQILKASLGAFASGAEAVSEPGKTFNFTLAQLKTLVGGGKCPNGKTLAAAIPNAAARGQFLDAAAMIVQNPGVFAKLDLSGPGMASMAMRDDKFSVTDLERLIGKQPALANRPTFEDLVKVTLAGKPTPVTARPIEIHDVTPARRAALATAYQKWADSTDMVKHHQAWHSANGSGGTQGKGSGEKFLQFHAQMEAEFITWLGKQKPPQTDLLDKNGLLPTWDTMTPLPKEFWPGTVKHQIDWKLPAFLTNTPDPTQEFKLDGRVIHSLNDLKNPDELGRVWGESGAHAVAHAELSGEMATFASVRDPVFMLWHFGVLETNRADWLKTDSGRAWQAKHPSGWTDPNVDAGKVAGGVKGGYPDGYEQTPIFTVDQIHEAGVGFPPGDPRRDEAARRTRR